ncbi:MAG: hypothetical protein GF308_00535 [Candidatus Heimdallarchaeota archaeon]|nr:hypothetical protein [Candidatus Heimdallarchaeota archaeon]
MGTDPNSFSDNPAIRARRTVIRDVLCIVLGFIGGTVVIGVLSIIVLKRYNRAKKKLQVVNNSHELK